jgi:hypothetical protein
LEDKGLEVNITTIAKAQAVAQFKANKPRPHTSAYTSPSPIGETKTIRATLLGLYYPTSPEIYGKAAHKQ